MKTCGNISALARELGVRRKWLYKWRDLAQSGRVPVVGRPAKPKVTPEEKDRKRITELERLVARQALEVDFFKGALQRVEEHRRKREQISGRASTSKSGK
jgi:transposase-like protein